MKIFVGKVIHTKMDKTATVAVERIVAHPVYKKRMKRVKKYHVHDTIGAKPGQTVRFIPSRPFSRLKKFKLIEIVDLKAEDEKKAKESKKTTVKEEGKKAKTKVTSEKKGQTKKTNRK